MKWLTRLALCAVGLTACNPTLTDTLGPPPSGLPVAMTLLAGDTPTPAFSGAGDSAVVAVSNIVLPAAQCFTGVVDAGVASGVLVITVVRNSLLVPPCREPPPSPFTIRFAVHSVPPGQYIVVLDYRDEVASGGLDLTQVAQGTVVLP